jgi:glycosyltransferase involved in cell wall biosynthesis
VTFLVLDAQLHKTSQFEILGNLAKKGYSATLIALQSKRRFKNSNPNVSVISIPLRNIPLITSFLYGLLVFLFLPIYVLSSNPEFIVTQPTIPIMSFVPLFLISRIKKLKLILDIRTVTVTQGFRGFLNNLLLTTSILVAKRLFSGITIITPSMKEELCRKYSLDRARVGVWASGVSPSLFDPNNYARDREKLRRQLGLDRKFVVFYHGVFSPDRGLVETIEAMKFLRRSHPEIVLFLLGSGPLYRILRESVEKGNLNANVIIHDSVDYEDVPRYISMCDVGIIPLPNMDYWRFQSPLKLLEYLAMKKVVIASDIPAHRAVIGGEECGIFVDHVSPPKIAESITYAFNNKDRLQDWGKTGRVIIERKYTWQKMADNFENYLLSIA